MSDLAICVEGLSKQYRLGAKRERYRMLRDTLTAAFMSPLRMANRWRRGQVDDAREPPDKIWALKDVSFEVQHGEVIGIIGRNGAGKSTLLKILCRITPPTAGFAELRGRVGSLLEVGTGFHNELTGAENIYLSGAILGMRRAEIARKFDEIVDFAEIERFVDTPVKHYSTGMYLRLAFAVAAHLEPEILLVDEVLAVGDATFQKKCLNKMQDVGQQGRTVLFVSHNMPAVTRLCERTILLDGGRVQRDGPSHQVIGAYLTSTLGTIAAREWPDEAKAPGDDIVRLRSVRVRTEDGRVTDSMDIRRPVGIEMEYEVLRSGYPVIPHFTLHNDEGIRVFVSFDLDPAWRGRPRPSGRYVSTGWIPGNFLSEGTMFVGPAMITDHPRILHFYTRDAVAFQVIDTLDGDSARGDFAGSLDGVVRPLLQWSTQYSPNGHRPHAIVTSLGDKSDDHEG